MFNADWGYKENTNYVSGAVNTALLFTSVKAGARAGINRARKAANGMRNAARNLSIRSNGLRPAIAGGYGNLIDDVASYSDDFSKNVKFVESSRIGNGAKGTGKADDVIQTTRRKAFRDAKRNAGIPASTQYKKHKYVYDGTSENRWVYEFNVDRSKKYIIKHVDDKFGRGPHFHGADSLKGSPFNKGRYNQYPGHFPEDFNGYRP